MNKTQRFLPGLAACIAGFVVFAGFSNTAFADPPYHRISVGLSLLDFSFDNMVFTVSAEVGTEVSVGLGGSDLTLTGDAYVSGDIQITTAGEGTYKADVTMGIKDASLGTEKIRFNLPALDVNLFSAEGCLGLSGPPGEFSLTGNEGDDWTFAGDDDSTLDIDKLLRDYYNQGTGDFLIPLPGGFTGRLDDLFLSESDWKYWKSYGGSFEGSATPAPGAAVLGLLGLGMVGWMKRRKKEA